MEDEALLKKLVGRSRCASASTWMIYGQPIRFCMIDLDPDPKIIAQHIPGTPNRLIPHHTQTIKIDVGLVQYIALQPPFSRQFSRIR